MRSETSSALLVGVATVLVLGTSGWFLFRQRTEDDPRLGQVTYKWRWGRAAEVLVDANRDGRTDLRLVSYEKSRDFYTHQAFREVWESSTCDGVLDRRVLMGNEGVEGLEYDRDRDGKFEVELNAADAIDFLKAHPRPSECGWSPTYTPKILEDESGGLPTAAADSS